MMQKTSQMHSYKKRNKKREMKQHYSWLPRLADNMVRHEWTQAILRVGITSAVIVYLMWPKAEPDNPALREAVTKIVGVYLLYSFILITSFWYWYHHSKKRTAMTLITDIGITVYVMSLYGESGTPFFVIMLWVSIGYGIRYGRNYLLASMVYSSLGITWLWAYSNYWQQHPEITASFLITEIAIPLFVSHLLHEIEKAKKVAEAASVAKSQFLANMSHEIRTPLTGIIGLANLMSNEKLNTEHQSHITAIIQSAENLLHLLNNALDITKIEANRLQLRKEYFDLHEMIGNLTKIYRPLAMEKNIRYKLDIATNLPKGVYGDAMRIRQILTNLLNNAIKFTDEGAITLAVKMTTYKKKEVNIRFIVKDTGIGIPNSKKERIFGTFEQADNSMTRRYGGTGLGLAISMQLAEVMGGTISVNTTEGKGSVFQLDVPLILTEEEYYTETYEPVEMEKEERLYHSRRVVLIEDNAIIQKVLSTILRKAGHEVVQESDGEKGLDRIFEEDYDVMIIDMNMPNISGLEVVRAYRYSEVGTTQHLPIIMVSANDTEKAQKEAKEVGVDEYLLKPVEAEKLLQKIEEHTARNRAVLHKKKPPKLVIVKN